MRGIWRIGPSNQGSRIPAVELRFVWVAWLCQWIRLHFLWTLLQILAQALFPRLRSHAGDPFVAFGREDGVRRPFRRPRKGVARDGTYRRFVVNDRAREVEPAALRLVRVVDDAARVLVVVRALRETNDRVGEMRRVGRPSALIVDDAQRIRSFSHLIPNRLDEVRTVYAKQPCGAEDE